LQEVRRIRRLDAIFPALASVVGGDVFSAEDRYGTWATILTRSRSRSDVFAGKVAAALSFSPLAVAVLALSSVAAGVIVIGPQSLIDLSGLLRSPDEALGKVALALGIGSAASPGVRCLAVVLSVGTRSSAAGIALPVVAGLTMQLAAMMDGPEPVRRLLLTSAFGAWHGLFTEPVYYGPMIHGVVVSGRYLILCLTLAYRMLQRRDIA
jgi:ABC-2 type transport system permease protein